MVSVLLAGSLLALQGLVYPHALEHVSHHARHGADVHSTVLCSWMCAAGQDLDIVVGLFHVAVPLIGHVDPLVSDSLPVESSALWAWRGPPAPSLS